MRNGTDTYWLSVWIMLRRRIRLLVSLVTLVWGTVRVLRRCTVPALSAVEFLVRHREEKLDGLKLESRNNK